MQNRAKMPSQHAQLDATFFESNAEKLESVPTHSSYVLVARDLVKTYGSGNSAVTALNNINLSVERGRFTAIMGPSGSGKSTLMHCLAGLDSITSGSVRLDGQELSLLSERKLTRLRRNKIGFIFQSFNLVPTLTAKENILLPRGIARRKVSRERFEQVVEAVGLTDRLGHFPTQLSGGQQQRVACARALVGSPAVVFADEPTGNLDSQSTYQVLQFLRQAVDEFGQTVVMVTHEADAAAWADRVVFIRDGQIAHELVQPTRDTVLDTLRLLGDTSTLGAAAVSVAQGREENIFANGSSADNYSGSDVHSGEGNQGNSFHSSEFAESEFMGIVTGEIEMVKPRLSGLEPKPVTAGTDFTKVRDAIKGKSASEEFLVDSTDAENGIGLSGSDLSDESEMPLASPATTVPGRPSRSTVADKFTMAAPNSLGSSLSPATPAGVPVGNNSSYFGNRRGSNVSGSLPERGARTSSTLPHEDVLAKRGYAGLESQMQTGQTPKIADNPGLSGQNPQIHSRLSGINSENALQDALQSMSQTMPQGASPSAPLDLPQEQREIIGRAQEILDQLPGSVMDDEENPR